MLAQSTRPNKNFTVPSRDAARRRTLCRLMEKFLSNSSRRSCDRLVISPNEQARFWNNHCHTCRARYDGCFLSTRKAVSSLKLKSLILGFTLRPRMNSTAFRKLKDLVGPEKEGNLVGRGLGATGTIHRVLFAVVAPILADRSRRRLSGVGGAHNFAIFQDGVFAL